MVFVYSILLFLFLTELKKKYEDRKTGFYSLVGKEGIKSHGRISWTTWTNYIPKDTNLLAIFMCTQGTNIYVIASYHTCLESPLERKCCPGYAAAAAGCLVTHVALTIKSDRKSGEIGTTMFVGANTRKKDLAGLKISRSLRSGLVQSAARNVNPSCSCAGWAHQDVSETTCKSKLSTGI